MMIRGLQKAEMHYKGIYFGGFGQPNLHHQSKTENNSATK